MKRPHLVNNKSLGPVNIQSPGSDFKIPSVNFSTHETDFKIPIPQIKYPEIIFPKIDLRLTNYKMSIIWNIVGFITLVSVGYFLYQLAMYTQKQKTLTLLNHYYGPNTNLDQDPNFNTKEPGFFEQIMPYNLFDL